MRHALCSADTVELTMKVNSPTDDTIAIYILVRNTKDHGIQTDLKDAAATITYDAGSALQDDGKLPAF